MIAIIQTLQAMMLYIESRMQGDNAGNIQKIILKCIHCFLETVKCIIDRFNKTAYIVAAIRGSAFCPSSLEGIKLMFSNPLRFSMLLVVGVLIERVGQFFILCATVLISIQWMQHTGLNEELSSVVMPATLVALISYFIVSMYMMVFRVGIDTIFFCFLIDEQCNKEKGREMRASEELKRIIDAKQVIPPEKEPEKETSWKELCCCCLADEADDVPEQAKLVNNDDGVIGV